MIGVAIRLFEGKKECSSNNKSRKFTLIMSRKRTPSKRNSLTTSELVVPGNDIGSQITSSLPNLRHDSSADLKQANGLYEREQYADGAEVLCLPLSYGHNG